MQDKEPVYKLIRIMCRNRYWTSREFAVLFHSVKFTSRCAELIKKGERFKTKVVTINGVKYKGYQYIGKKAA